MKMYLNGETPYVEGTPEEMLEFIHLVIQDNNDPVTSFLNGMWKGESHEN